MKTMTGLNTETIAFFSNHSEYRGVGIDVEIEHKEHRMYVNDRLIAKRLDNYDYGYFYSFDNTGIEEESYIYADCLLKDDKEHNLKAVGYLNGILEFLEKPYVHIESGRFYWKNGTELKNGFNRI